MQTSWARRAFTRITGLRSLRGRQNYRRAQAVLQRLRDRERWDEYEERLAAVSALTVLGLNTHATSVLPSSNL